MFFHQFQELVFCHSSVEGNKIATIFYVRLCFAKFQCTSALRLGLALGTKLVLLRTPTYFPLLLYSTSKSLSCNRHPLGESLALIWSCVESPRPIGSSSAPSAPLQTGPGKEGLGELSANGSAIRQDRDGTNGSLLSFLRAATVSRHRQSDSCKTALIMQHYREVKCTDGSKATIKKPICIKGPHWLSAPIVFDLSHSLFSLSPFAGRSKNRKENHSLAESFRKRTFCFARSNRNVSHARPRPTRSPSTVRQ